MKTDFGMPGDGIVPYLSAAFTDHALKKVQVLQDYDHEEIAKGKGDRILFGKIQADLLNMDHLIVKHPNGGEIVGDAEPIEIKWLTPGDVDKVDISYSADGGATYTSIARGIHALNEVYHWNAPEVNSRNCLVRVSNSADSTKYDVSDQPFRIYCNWVNVLWPDGSKSYEPYDTVRIAWKWDGLETGSFSIVYKNDNAGPNGPLPLVIRDSLGVKEPTSLVWTVPDTMVGTTAGKIVISFRPGERSPGSSKYFKMWPPRKITVVSPNGNERLEYGKNPVIRWKSEGNVGRVTISIGTPERWDVITGNIANSGADSSWKVDHYSQEKFWIKLVDEERSAASQSAARAIPAVQDLSDAGFYCKMGAPQPLEPANDPVMSPTTSVIPRFIWDPHYSWWISPSRVNRREDRLQLSHNANFESLVLDTIIVNDSSFQSPELDLGRSYYWRVLTDFTYDGNKKGVSYWSDHSGFKTERIPPQSSTSLLAPQPGEKIPETDVFTWSKVLRARSYWLQITKDSSFSALVVSKSFDGDTSVTVTVPYDESAFYWRVRPSNGYGTGPQSATRPFRLMEKSQRWKNFFVHAEKWERASDTTNRAIGNIRIQPLNEAKHSIRIEGGSLVVDTGKTRVYNASGKVSFVTDKGTVPLYSGEFSLTDDGLYRTSKTVTETASEQIGKLPLDSLNIEGVLFGDSWYVSLRYSNNRLVIDVPGIRMRQKEPIAFDLSGPVQLAGSGVLKAAAADITLNIASIELGLSGIELQGDINGIAEFTSASTSVRIGTVFSPTPYDLDLGRSVSIGVDHSIAFKPDDLTLFPNLQILAFFFENPSLKFEYAKEIGAYVLSGNGLLVLPFQRSGNAGQFPSASGSSTGVCRIFATVKLRSTPPYLYYASVLSDGCRSVPIVPGIAFSGAGGDITLGADESGDINWVVLGGTGIFTFGTNPILPLMKTYAGFTLDSRGKFSLQGDCRALGYVTFAKAKLWFDASQKNTLVVGGSGHLELPPGLPIFVTNLSGAMQFGVPQGFSNPIQKMYFSGSAKVQIPKKIFSFWELEYPKDPITLQGIRVEAGEFRDGGSSKGFGVQANVELATITYYDIHGKHTYHLKVDLFVSLKDGSMRVGRDLYDLVRFSSNIALRRKGDISKMKNVRTFAHAAAVDTIRFDVPASTSEGILVGLQYSSSNLPELTLISPGNDQYDSKSFLEMNPDLLTDAGYMMYAPRVQGEWTAVIKNADPVSGYKFNVGGQNVAPTLSIGKIESTAEGIKTIGFAVSDPDDRPVLNLYFADSDTAPGVAINPADIVASNGAGQYIWNTRGVRNGEYRVYGLVGDGKHAFVRGEYAGSVTVANNAPPASPQHLEAFARDSSIQLRWTDPDQTGRYYVLIGRTSQTYTDTMLVTNGHLYEMRPETNSMQYYAAVLSEDINGHRSGLSEELVFNRQSAQANVVPPLQPSFSMTQVFLPDLGTDSGRVAPAVRAHWNRVPGAAGYELSYVSRNSDARFTFDVGDRDSADVDGLLQGQSYRLMLRAYNRAGQFSTYAPDVQVDVFDHADNDGDGILDAKELLYFGSTTATDDPSTDPDGDGLTTAEELAQGTNPNNVDTDGDWVWDDVDAHPTVNKDLDGNRLGDDWDAYFGAHDPSTDQDGDGLSNLTEFQFGSDPNKVDTDGGGKSDKEEYDLNLNPRDPKDDKSDIKGFVKVDSFTMTAAADSTILSWATREEKDLAGFNLYRRSAGDAFFRKLNQSLIPRLQDTLRSHRYTYVDRVPGGQSGQTYFLEGEGIYGNRDSLAFVPRVSGVVADGHVLPTEFFLGQNYPNPFNPSTRISFSVPKLSEVSIVVYDLLGREVSRLVQGRFAPGAYTVTWNAGGCASGAYLVRMTSTGFSQTRVMVLLR